MSCNVATSKFLKTTFFKYISVNIQELDLSAIVDVDLKKFSAAVRNLRKLKTLNVSYTNIKFEDIAGLNIHETCPSLKNVSINFNYECILPANLSNSTNFVQRLEDMHLIVTLNHLFYPKLLFMLFKKANLNTLKLTSSRRSMTTPIEEHQIVNQIPVFNQLYVHLLNWRQLDKCIPSLIKMPILHMLDLNKYEFIIILSPSLTTQTVFTSNVFVVFFSKHFDLNVRCISDFNDVFGLDTEIPSNAAIMIWRKDVNNFDDIFFRNLYRDIRQYFPYCPKSRDSVMPNTYNWFVFTPTIPENNKEAEIKIKQQSFDLNYDTLFENKQEIQMSFDFNNLVGIPVTLNITSKYLSKITYLSLCGLAKYTPNFFRTLFQCCTKLNTLNVETAFESSCWLPLCQSLQLSSSLKNFRLVDSKINCQTFLLAFCSCKSIEKIYIKENIEVTQHTDINSSTLLSLLFLNCPNLYSLDFRTRESYARHVPTFIEIVSNSSVTIKRQPTTEQIWHPAIYNYDPDIDVFNLNPITQI
ncbi:hypothetical protein K1T71_012865 [Dendrolimus kikuchii]|uniref:Uncharacterized protein n=1 Tax=Dendrolimus kikuchii TaxID=765133 RepID=A0ACC1CIB0_9NEOP|nr:hypothetical protein K1T71_012865 [Dendrolimus kikuchii]